MTNHEQKKFNQAILDKLDEIKSLFQKEEPTPPSFMCKNEFGERQDLREAVINGLFGDDKWDSHKVRIETFPKNITKELKFFDQPDYLYYESDVCNSGMTSFRTVDLSPKKYEIKYIDHKTCVDELTVKINCDEIMEQAMSGFCNTLIRSCSATTSYELPKDASNIQVRMHSSKGKKYIIAFSMDDIAVAFDDQSIEMEWYVNSTFSNNTARMSLYLDVQAVRPERICMIPIL